MVARSSHDGSHDTACVEAVQLLANFDDGTCDEQHHDEADLELHITSVVPKSRGQTTMRSFYSLMGVDTPFDPECRFESSWLFPAWLWFGLRALISLYSFTTLFFIMGWQGTHNNLIGLRRSFSFFTVLTYWGLAFYFFFAAIHTFGYARNGRPSLSRWPRSLQALHSLYYTTIITFPFLVTIVFWVVLYKGQWFTEVFLAWSNVSQHAINSGFALLELLFARSERPPLLHLAFLIVLLALYLGLAYVTYAAQHWYTYSFLDPATAGSARVAAYVFGILAAIIVIFAIVSFLVWLRRWITESLLKLGEKSRRTAATRASDIEMSTGYAK